MPKPTDPATWAYQFTDDIGFSQKCVLIHPTDSTKFLTIRRSTSSTNSGLWDFPGGNVLFGELHMDSLLQEISEETGITHIPIPKPILVHSKFYEDKDFYRLFIGYVSTSSVQSVTLSSEHDDFKWLQLDEFLLLDSKDVLKEVARKAFSKS